MWKLLYTSLKDWWKISKIERQKIGKHTIGRHELGDPKIGRGRIWNLSLRLAQRMERLTYFQIRP